jgi:sulfonate transport system permease protein
VTTVEAGRAVRSRGATQAFLSRLALRVRSGAYPATGLLVLLAAWELIARTVASGRHIVPTIPQAVSAMFRDEFYLAHVETTLWEAARGFFWGNLAAFAVAAVCVLVPPLSNVLTRIAMATYCTPTIAVAPLLIVLFTLDTTKVVMAALSVFFPTLLGTLLGLASAPQSVLDLVHVTGGSRLFALTRVRLRAGVAATAGALSLAAPAAVVGAMIGEYLGGDSGMGVVLIQAQQSLNVDTAWAVAIEATAISTFFYLVIGALAKRLSYTSTSTDVALTTGGSQSTKGPLWLRPIRAIASLAAVLLAWYGFVRGFDLDRYLAKTPNEVWTFLTRAPNANENLRSILTELRRTLLDASVGYLAGTVIALVLAALFLNWSLLEGMFLPVVMTVRAVPLVAMIPIIALIFGRGLLTVAVLAGAVTFVPTLVIVLASLRAVPKPATELLHVYAMGKARSLLTVRMLYAIPAIASSARIAVPGAILGAVLAELLATGSGIGHLIAVSIATSAYLTLWSALAIVSAVTAVLYMILSAVEVFALSRLAQ